MPVNIEQQWVHFTQRELSTSGSTVLSAFPGMKIEVSQEKLPTVTMLSERHRTLLRSLGLLTYIFKYPC